LASITAFNSKTGVSVKIRPTLFLIIYDKDSNYGFNAKDE